MDIYFVPNRHFLLHKAFYMYVCLYNKQNFSFYTDNLRKVREKKKKNKQTLRKQRRKRDKQRKRGGGQEEGKNNKFMIYQRMDIRQRQMQLLLRLGRQKSGSGEGQGGIAFEVAFFGSGQHL